MFVWYSEEEQAYLVELPALPGCMADGSTMEEAIRANPIMDRSGAQAGPGSADALTQPASCAQDASCSYACMSANRVQLSTTYAHQ